MKKLISTLLLSLMVCLTLIGCGKNDAKDQGAAGQDGTGSIKVKMVGFRQDAHIPFADSPFYREMEEKTGVRIEWVDWTNSQIKEKRNLTFASGNLPDAFCGSFIFDGPDVVRYGMDGFFADIKPYINEEYMPNFYRLCQMRPEILSAITTPDGKVYALPTIIDNPSETTNDTLVINTDWLRKVGKEMPTTTDEFFDVLMAFKAAGDLNGNGRNDEIPLTFVYNQGNMGLYSFMGWTGLVYNNQHCRMARKDGQIVFVPATDEFKEWVIYMHKLYENGLIDPEAFTMKPAAFNAKTQTAEPTCGVISAWSAEKINNLIPGNDIYADGVYQYMPPITGPSGVTPKWCLRTTPPNRQFSFAINAESRYIEQLVRWADLHYDPEISLHAAKGIQGTHYDIVNDNGDFVILTKENGSKYSDQEIAKNVPGKDALCAIVKEVHKDVSKANAQGKAKAHEVYGDYLDYDYVKSYALQTPEEAERIAILMPDIKSYVDTRVAKFITEGGIEEGWDAYIKGLKTINIDEYVELYTEIDRRSSTN